MYTSTYRDQLIVPTIQSRVPTCPQVGFTGGISDVLGVIIYDTVDPVLVLYF